MKRRRRFVVLVGGGSLPSGAGNSAFTRFRSSMGRHGFVQTSSAPASRARRSCSGSACPVSTNTRTAFVAPSSFSRRVAVQPSIPGSARSITMTSGRDVRARARPSSASPAVRTRRPAKEKYSAYISRLSTTSSMMRIVGLRVPSSDPEAGRLSRLRCATRTNSLEPFSRAPSNAARNRIGIPRVKGKEVRADAKELSPDAEIRQSASQ